MLDDATPILASREMAWGSGSVTGVKTLTGALVYRPREFLVVNTGGGGVSGRYHYAGRCYQQLLVGSDTIEYGSRFDVPLDTGIYGTFMLAAGQLPQDHRAVCYRVA